MRTLLTLAALGWAMSLLWATPFGYIVLTVSVIVILWRLSVLTERRASSPWHSGNTINQNYVTALEAMVVQTEAELERQRVEIGQLRSALRASEPDPMAAVYQRVGLSKGAPPWLVASARRAYRSALHPDRHPPYRKLEAERRFKEAEAIFEQIGARG